MTDVFDRIKAVNPVPDPDRYYESMTRDRRNHMTVDEITRPETPQDSPSQSGFRGWKVAATAAAVVALFVGFVAIGGGDDVAGSGNLEIEQEIIALIEDWTDVWNTGDGQAAVDLFTADGRYVGAWVDTGIDGWSGDELKAGIERRGSAANRPIIVGSPLIIERDDHYQVAAIWRPNSVGGGEDNFFSMTNIVEENGSLKIRYAEFWAPLGWFQLADGLPYQVVNPE